MSETDSKSSGDEVTLERSVPQPQKWKRVDSYYFEWNGKRIHEEGYYAKLKDRLTLAQYIEEVEPPEEDMPRYD
jgi:hypothetical protein